MCANNIAPVCCKVPDNALPSSAAVSFFGQCIFCAYSSQNSICPCSLDATVSKVASLLMFQAMQQWNSQQWPAAVAPMGLAQGWLRPYSMSMTPTAVGMSPRGPGQGKHLARSCTSCTCLKKLCSLSCQAVPLPCKLK